jgi:sugar/nucleoside kinase (ribokinase family)
MKYDVVGLGNALLDYQTQVPFELLQELGVTKGSMTLVEAALQKSATESIQRRYHQGLRVSSGGCAANTLAGFAQFGGRGFLFGRTGTDAAAEHYAQDLQGIGVATALTQDPDGVTGTCLALITPDAERTMLTHLGVAIKLSEVDIQAEPIQNAGIVYIEGYLWDSPTARAASQKAIQIARDAGKSIAFTYSDSFCVDRHKADFIDLAKNHINILFCNETEATMATGESDPQKAFQVMKEWSDIVCMTWGPKGALLSDRRRGIVEEVGTWDVKVVDKLGAGDLFASGVLYGLTTGKSLKEAGYLGCYAATRVIQQMGARLSHQLMLEVPIALTGPRAA